MQVSVIITCHNYARYLARAIRSAINQSVNKNEYEVIVVDDASTDETQLVMEAFKGHIKPIILKKISDLPLHETKAFDLHSDVM